MTISISLYIIFQIKKNKGGVYETHISHITVLFYTNTADFSSSIIGGNNIKVLENLDNLQSLLYLSLTKTDIKKIENLDK